MNSTIHHYIPWVWTDCPVLYFSNCNIITLTYHYFWEKANNGIQASSSQMDDCMNESKLLLLCRFCISPEAKSLVPIIYGWLDDFHNPYNNIFSPNSLSVYSCDFPSVLTCQEWLGSKAEFSTRLLEQWTPAVGSLGYSQEVLEESP